MFQRLGCRATFYTDEDMGMNQKYESVNNKVQPTQYEQSSEVWAPNRKHVGRVRPNLGHPTTPTTIRRLQTPYGDA